jgi:hypothetical protein
MEQTCTDDSPDDDPDSGFVNIIFLETFAFCFARRQPYADDNRNQQN